MQHSFVFIQFETLSVTETGRRAGKKFSQAKVTQQLNFKYFH